MQLFLQAARWGHADCSFSDEEKAIIARICRLVEGVPLAVELAAAWVRTLSFRQIAQEIEKSFGFLSTTMGDVSKRHRSMRAVFEHLWNLLEEEDRHALSGLSVLKGRPTRNSAEPIAVADLSRFAALMESHSHTLAGRSGMTCTSSSGNLLPKN